MHEEGQNNVENWRVRFVSRVEYPSPAANALQTLQMAAAFARVTGDCHLFVHSLENGLPGLLNHYGVEATPLQVKSGRLEMWPGAVRNHGLAKFFLYNSSTALRLIFANRFLNSPGNVLFVRSRLELNYWGLLRPYLPWLRRWRFVYECHDLETSRLGGRTPDANRLRRALAAMRRFDLVVAITGALAVEIREASDGTVDPRVVTLASGLERLHEEPTVALGRKTPIVLGYVGTVDQMRGVGVLLEALPLIPEPVRLRIVGRIAGDGGDGQPEWLRRLLVRPEISSRVELRPPVPYSSVAAEIDSCDIALLPAGVNEHASKYAAPLKLFDYMARGKPIVAAGVDCHREILRDRVDASLYEPGSPKSAAKSVTALIRDAALTQRLATNAWRKAEQFTYDARARRILEMLNMD